MDPITKALIRLALKVVENVLSQLTKLLNGVQEQAFAPLKAIVGQVTGGVWIGKGADAFVDELSSLMIPGVGRVIEHISKTSSNIQTAKEIIQRADEEVDRLVQSRLSDGFKFY